MDGSPKVVKEELENNLIEICEIIHNFSFEVFAHRVNKRKKKLSTIMTYIQNDQTQFTPNNRSTLLEFLQDVEAIIMTVDGAQATEQLHITSIQMLRGMHAYWTKKNLLPKDPLAHDQVTLLDTADTWLRSSA
jgi:hypothetical protein